jgi:hypothetical protein
LRALAKPLRRWIRMKQPAPLLFTEERIRNSVDVFPLEFVDIKQSHRVLAGSDPFVDLEVGLENLRLELEHELKGKLLKLRSSYVLSSQRPRDIRELIIHSISTFLVLFRGVLRLYGEVPSSNKWDALERLAGYIPFQQDVFRKIRTLRESRKVAGGDLDILMADYVEGINTIIDAVDAKQVKSYK